jgi:amino acid adenylation domain-containing protein
MAVVVGELRALMANPQLVLPPAAPYRNFITETRTGVTREEHQAFFTRLLGDVEEPTAPFGIVDVQSNDRQAEEAALPLGADLSRRIRERCRALGVTPASLFHLAWVAVLGHISSREDVVFGTVLFGRMRSGAGAARAVGMFINTLPIRLKLDRTSAAESLVRIHELLSELMVHEHAPLSLAQRCSSVLPPAPLFSSLFNYRHNSAESAESGWPGVEMLNASERTNYPLAMAVDDSSVGFTLTALGQAATHPARVCAYLQQALKGLMDLLEHSPSVSIAALPILPRAERRMVLEKWNRTDRTFETGTLDGLFSAQARRSPQAIAVVGRDGAVLTYAELDAQSTELAGFLVGRGVGPERVVGVRMERSAETIVALLGVLKAGGVYLPLDPDYPAERLDFIASDAGAVLILDSIPPGPPVEVSGFSNSHRLAYIIYTSGTTGLPKGVAVSHGAAVNMAFARRACHDPLGPGDRVLAAISVGFDVSIGQLLLPLLSGAAVVIAGDLKTLGPAGFWSLLARERVTHINSVPSFLDSTLDAVPADGQLALKRLMLGGEALSGALVGRLQRALPGVEVVNMYGPTETCIDATYHVVAAGAGDLAAAVLPIGLPLSNYQAYILDSHLEPVAIGVEGELYLGGAGLARGYVHAPDLTAERFVADPFSPVGGARLYRTGDRARRRTDGRIEFLGRVDQQIKIRGFRVEPGEIEAQLKKQPGIREAAVVMQSGRLVAYYMGSPASLEALRAVLPDYMVPSALIHLDRLPLSANGKLDRKALPRESVLIPAATYEAPRDPAELALQQIFQTVLAVERVSLRDNFFELGGDSLRAMRLVNAINTEFESSFPMRLLFEYPTIESLAVAMRLRVNKKGLGNLIPLQPGGKKRPLFCVHPAGGHVFCYLPLARALGPDQPVYGLQASGLEEEEPQSPATSIEEMASAYVQSIKTLQPEGPYQLLGMSSGGLIAYEMARQFKAAGEVVSALTLLDTTVPGSNSETFFSEELLLQAMAGELGCADLLTGAAPGLTLQELVRMGREAGRLPADFSFALAQRIADSFRNTVRMHFAYSPQKWDGRMLVVRALRRFREDDFVPDWSPHATGGLEVADFDCGHSDLVSAALAPAIAEIVKKQLN